MFQGCATAFDWWSLTIWDRSPQSKAVSFGVDSLGSDAASGTALNRGAHPRMENRCRFKAVAHTGLVGSRSIPGETGNCCRTGSAESAGATLPRPCHGRAGGNESTFRPSRELQAARQGRHLAGSHRCLAGGCPSKSARRIRRHRRLIQPALRISRLQTNLYT